MKRILILVGVMVMGCLVSSSAMAGLGAGISLDYFNPNYGEINDVLAEINEMIEETPGVESDLGFGGGLAWTIGLDYDINPNWVIKGEYLNFSRVLLKFVATFSLLSLSDVNLSEKFLF